MYVTLEADRRKLHRPDDTYVDFCSQVQTDSHQWKDKDATRAGGNEQHTLGCLLKLSAIGPPMADRKKALATDCWSMNVVGCPPPQLYITPRMDSDE